jgi:Gpi18-like mannosyltransferase
MPAAARPLPLPPVWVSVAAFVLLGWWTREAETEDMATFLLPWLAHIRALGPVTAFAEPFSNYAPPYLYLLAAVSPLAAVIAPAAVIKLLSLTGNLVLALAMRRLLISLEAPQPGRAAALSLLAPATFANAALLHQCDALWAAALVMAVAAAVERRHPAMFAWCGIGLAFKAQAALAGPFFLALALARGVPFRVWLTTPAAMIAPMIPAVLAGWPVADLLTIYLRQAQYTELLSLNAPNIWAIIQLFAGPSAAALGPLAFAATAIAGAWYVARLVGRLHAATPSETVAAAALAVMLTAGLLPRMHERYFFLADVLAIALLFARPTTWRVALGVQLGSALAILAYLTPVPAASVMLLLAGAVAMIAATFRLFAVFRDNTASHALALPRSGGYGAGA